MRWMKFRLLLVPFFSALLLMSGCTALVELQAKLAEEMAATMAAQTAAMMMTGIATASDLPRIQSETPVLPLSTPMPDAPAAGAMAETGTPTEGLIQASSEDSGEPGTIPPERTQYHIIANYDAENHRIAVEEHIVYLNSAMVDLDTLVFILEPARLANDFTLLEITWLDGGPVDPYLLADGVLRVPLAAPLPPGEHIALVMAFGYTLPAQDSQFGYSARQANFADWYAFAPVVTGEGWLVHPPGVAGEHLVYALADFRVELRVSGVGEMVVAAPVPVEREGEVHRFYRQAARNFTLSISPEYVLLEEGNVRAFVFPEHAAAGRSALGCVVEALDLFSALYGDPELQWMNLVEAEFPDGMEYDGLFFLNQDYFEYPGAGAQGGLCALSVHETAHQWWYRLVGNDTALEPWLDEALCTYSELIYYEHMHPGLVSWWWGYRINDYNPSGWVNSTIYDHSHYRAYVNAVYLRGARFLDALRHAAGNEAMLTFLQAYAGAYRFSQADAAGFFRIWAETTGVDVQPILEQYFKNFNLP